MGDVVLPQCLQGRQLMVSTEVHKTLQRARLCVVCWRVTSPDCLYTSLTTSTQLPSSSSTILSPRVRLPPSNHLTSRTWDFQVKVSEYTLQRSAQAILLTLSDNSQRQVWCHYKISFDMDAYGQELHTTDTTVDTSYLLHVCVVSVHIVSVNYIHTSFTFRTKMKTTSHLKLKKLIRWAWRKS